MFRRSPLVWGFISFAAGIVYADAPGVPALCGLFCNWQIPLALAALAVFYRLRWGVPSRAALLLFLTLCTAAGLLLGFRALEVCHHGPNDSLDGLSGDPVWLSGTVSGRPVSRFRDSSLILRISHAETDGRTVSCRGRLRLGFPTPTVLSEPAMSLLPSDGQSIRFLAVPRRPLPFDNPGRFDYPRHLAARGVSHTARLKSARLIQPLIPPPPDTAREVSRWVETTVRSVFGNSDSGRMAMPGAMLSACLTGNRRWIDPGDEELLRRSGLAHLLAISGLHLGLLGCVLSWLLSRCRSPILIRRLALIAFFIFYLQLAGGTPSVNRAVIMATVYLTGQLLGCRPRPVNSLAAAGLVILLFNPLMLFDAGFQLTFGATFSILVLTPVFTIAARRDAPVGTQARTIAMGLPAVSLSVFLGIAPLQAALFHRATPATLLTNLAAGPLLGLTLSAGLLLLAAQFLSSLLPQLLLPPLLAVSAAGAGLVELGCRSILFLARHSAPWSFRIPDAGPWTCTAYYLCLIAAVLLRRHGHTQRRQAAVVLAVIVAPCLLLLATCFGGRWLPHHAVRVTFLDVGQGDSAIVEGSPGRALLIDGGGALPGGFDFGERVVSPALWRLGRHQLQAVAITHGHQDHAGGLAAVVGNFRPRAILAGGQLQRQAGAVCSLLESGRSVGAVLLPLRRGRVIRCGEADLIVLHPPSGGGTEGSTAGLNDNSLVLLLRHGRVKMLFTGDLESEGERTLMRSPLSTLAACCDLLKVGHHGAPDASSAPWLRLVSPKVSVITAGRLNRFGHPDPAIYQRLRNAGCQRIHSTGRNGALTVVSDGKRLYLRSGGS